MQDLVPALHDLAVLSYNGLQSFVKVGLEIAGVLQTMRMHEGLNFRIARPLLAVHLVAADMKILVGKEPRHLADKLIKKFVRVLARRVHGRVMNSEMT